jgi:hypothetical protein
MKKFGLLLMVIGVLAGQGFCFAEEGLAKKAGDGIKKGGEAAARGVEKGVDAAGKGIKKGLDATGKGLKKAGDWVGKKTR